MIILYVNAVYLAFWGSTWSTTGPFNWAVKFSMLALAAANLYFAVHNG